MGKICTVQLLNVNTKGFFTDQQLPVKKEVEEYDFLEQPSDDFFCPVTFGLLLQPHLTSCCGKHLSQEAATRIQEEGGACPLCNSPCLISILNKHFRRQVNALHIFCPFKNRGCTQKDELSTIQKYHVPKCQFRPR